MTASFAFQLQGFTDQTKQQYDDTVGLVISKIAEKLDLRSPVGDASYWKNKPPKGYVGGRFRGNWQLGIDDIPLGETGRIDPSGVATIGAITGAIPQEAAGHIYYLTNNVPYAQRLEEGWSRQAPQGLVALTVVEFPMLVRESTNEAVKS